MPYSKLGSGDLSSLTSCPEALFLPFWRNLKWPLPALSHYAPAPTPQGFQFFKPELRPVPSQHLILSPVEMRDRLRDFQGLFSLLTVHGTQKVMGKVEAGAGSLSTESSQLSCGMDLINPIERI